MWLMGRSYMNAKATRAWDSVEATVLQVEVAERKIGEHVPTDYSASVLYGYVYQGERLTSETITPRGAKWVKDRSKAEKELADYTVGQAVTCWVNPQDSTQAILKHDTKAAGYSIWFPCLFFVGGIGICCGAFRKR